MQTLHRTGYTLYATNAGAPRIVVTGRRPPTRTVSRTYPKAAGSREVTAGLLERHQKQLNKEVGRRTGLLRAFSVRAVAPPPGQRRTHRAGR
ncbi:hypothetical protein [Streptomyces sp. NBC_00271]|uniref:hypothetical protein n=1 Tax=Streptomyces sp. NBC_00271 TaxID=2975697 RepID=UPI002E29DF06|nr:hypothetical protein [Streptomyces sp. NBC_00271]